MHVTSEGKEASAMEQITNLLFSGFLRGCTHLTAFCSLASPSIEAVDHWPTASALAATVDRGEGRCLSREKQPLYDDCFAPRSRCLHVAKRYNNKKKVSNRTLSASLRME